MKTFGFTGSASWRFRALASAFFLTVAIGFYPAYPQTRDGPSVTREFCGSTPCDSSIRELLGISTNGLKEIPELMEWQLTLHRDPKTLEPAKYELRCDYGITVPNHPGIGKRIATIRRDGKWSIKATTNSTPTVTYDLAGAISLRQIQPNILHLLKPDRTLMIGNGGWSYTLNATAPAEAIVDPALARTVPDMSYPISPLATAPAVLAVFEGRTPCLGIARELKIPVPASATKAKWRITFHQDPATGMPTTYKIEGTLFRRAAREGKWTITRGTKTDPTATIYQLTSPDAEPLHLLKGDDNVLFFLDQNRTPMVGHCEFSYTLNRRLPN